MKKLIYLTGQIDSPFLTNEIDEFRSEFDEIFVIAYGEDRKTCDEISRAHGFKYAFISDVSFGLKTISKLRKWKKQDYVKDELKRVKSIKPKKFKRKLYVYYYGIYALKLNKILEGYFNDEDEFYVYSFWLSRPAFGVATLLSERKEVRRAVSRTHRYDLYEEENDLKYLPFRRFITEHLNTIYFSSVDTINYFDGKNYSDKKPEYKLAYLGTKEYERKVIDENKTGITIASCSYVIQRKRLDLIIDLVKRVYGITGDVTWLHIGDGEDEEKVKELASRELAGVKYSFLGKMADEKIFETYKYNDVDYFVNLSDSEGIPVSILEAMSMGIPIVARNVGGIADAVGNDTGILIKESGDALSGGIENAARIMVDKFNDKAEYNALGANAYAKWKNRFSTAENSKRVAKDIISGTEIKEIK